MIKGLDAQLSTATINNIESTDALLARWRIAEPPPDGFHLNLQGLAPANNIRLASLLMYNRGIKTDEDAHAFLNNSMTDMQHPSELPDVDGAVKIIHEAIKNGNRIGIIGDFDADGITATAILVLALRRLGVDAEWYLPHRESEGHGVSKDALKQLHDKGVGAVITVDTGISDFDAVEYANSLDMKMVITDHHEPTTNGKLPSAAAIVNPHLAEDSSTMDYCGAAIAFKLATALLEECKSKPMPELIPLAAVGTLADRTNLLHDNRIIVRKGLEMLDKDAPPGLMTLTRLAADSVKHNGPYDANFIGFQVAPRLNAPGRIASADPSLELLICDDFDTARRLAMQLDDANKERRKLAESAWRDVEPQIKASTASDKKVLMLEIGNEYPMGVLGPLAGNAADKSGIPSIAYQIVDDVARASARNTLQSFNLHQALSGFADRLIRFGGHAAAAGFHVHAKHLNDLIKHLEIQSSWSSLNGSETVSVVMKEADCEIELHQIGGGMWDFVDKMSPFGPSNPEPVFIVRRATYSNAKVLGRNQNHLRLTLSDYTQTRIDAFGFNMAERLPARHPTVDAVVTLHNNWFRNRRRRELRLLDISASSQQ